MTSLNSMSPVLCTGDAAQVPHAADEAEKPGSTPPNWRVLRTAIGPASMAGQLAVRSTRTQYLAGRQAAVNGTAGIDRKREICDNASLSIVRRRVWRREQRWRTLWMP